VGKWADAFKAHIRARDTADTGDTSQGGPEALQCQQCHAHG
jgi:hypothetical protein